MAKKQKTIQQQAKTYRNIKWACFGGEFLAVITPFIVIGIANYDKYFIEYDGTKMSISLIMALALMGFTIWAIAKKKLENSLVTFMIKWATVAFIFTLMGQIIMDIAYIMWFGLIGLAVAEGLDIASKKAEKKQKKLLEDVAKAQSELNVEQAKEELTKVKVKIKK